MNVLERIPVRLRKPAAYGWFALMTALFAALIMACTGDGRFV